MKTNEALRNIKERRSIRAFRPEQLEEEAVQAILEAGLYAPYAQEGSRHFTVIQDRGLLDRLSAAAKAAAVTMEIPGLMEIGRDEDFHALYKAPTAVIISGNEATVGFEHDCAAAAQNILIAAQSLDIGSCWVYYTLLAFATPQGAALLEELQIPQGYRPVVSIALGYKRETPGPATRDFGPVTYIR